MFKQRLFYWLPRALAILFALFLGLFALDVFAEYDKIHEILLALSIHLIPVYILIGALVIAWRWNKVGGLLFIVLGLLSVLAFNTYEHLLTILLISTPPIVIGMLFMMQSHWNASKRLQYF